MNERILPEYRCGKLECVVIVKIKPKILEAILLTDWNKGKFFIESSCGKIPPVHEHTTTAVMQLPMVQVIARRFQQIMAILPMLLFQAVVIHRIC